MWTIKERTENLVRPHSWEMSTIGHPLSDLSNLLTPYATSANPHAKSMTSKSGGNVYNDAFIANTTPGLPAYSQCIAWYAEVVEEGPRKTGRAQELEEELKWGNAFNVFKGAIIMQGIAARYAVRQASSEKAKEYGAMMGPMGEVTWDLVTEVTTSKGNELAEKARL